MEELESLATDICDRVEEWGGRKFFAMEMTLNGPSDERARISAYLTTIAIGALCPSAWDLDIKDD